MKVAIGPLKHLTEQAEFAIGEAGKGGILSRHFPSGWVLAAASPHSHVAVWPNWTIVIWYGEELAQ